MTDETRRDWTQDDGFADFLRRHGADYHRPPETPVEAIWEGVREARERDDDGGVVPIASRRWLLPALAVAAVLVLGIALGRISMRQATEADGPGGPAVATRVDEPAQEGPDPDRGTNDPAASTGGTVPGDPGAPAATDAPAPDALAATTPERREPARPSREARATRPEAPPAGAPRPERPTRPADATDLYRLASVQMLAQAEALLVDYRSGRVAGRDDAAAIGRWARDVLSSTRLLIDSRAARDPEMRALLEDLELVLAQIVHHTGADPIEGEWIDRTIEERDLIPRLRMAIPSGGAPIGT